MKVKDLIKSLENANPEMEVFCTSNTGYYEYGLVNSAIVSKIRIDEVNYAENEEDYTTAFIIDEQ